METRYFLTIDWCNTGRRGIFCNKDGSAFPKDGSPHTENEMWKILQPFDLVLNPQSIELTETELKKYNCFVPLAEFSDQYGIALKPILDIIEIEQ